MKIGIAGPVDLSSLKHLFYGNPLPSVYSVPVVSMLILELWRRGHKLTVFCISTDITEITTIQGDSVCLVIIPSMKKKKLAFGFYRKERCLLTDVMNLSDCEVVHAHWTYQFGAAAVVCNKPHVITAHDAPLAILRYQIRPRIALNWILRTWVGIRTCRRANYLTAVSPATAQHVKKWFFPRNRVMVTPNGIPEEIFYRKSCSISETGRSPVIISVISWWKLKNPKNALKAFRIIRSSCGDVVYRIYGSGCDTGGEAHQWAVAHKLDKGVEFRGKIPHGQLLEQISKSTVLFHPSFEESCCMSICEAMALGVPVVAGKKSGGVPFTLDYGRAGVLVDVHSPQDIARGILCLLNDDKMRGDVAAKGKEYAWNNFTTGKMADRYEKVYRAVLNGSWDADDSEG